MNATEIKEMKLSPDGSAAVMATVSPDWQYYSFRSRLWISKVKTGKTIPLTQSGHALSPQWSPDGRYISRSSPIHVFPLQESSRIFSNHHAIFM
jgi:dipeptidyl aminopeptidase/acylaminoacyl peptidase